MIQNTTQAASPESGKTESGKTADGAPTAPDSRATTFQAVEGGTEQHSGTTLLVEAYAVLWVILMAWLLLLWRRQATVSKRLDELEGAIDRAAAKLEKK